MTLLYLHGICLADHPHQFLPCLLSLCSDQVLAKPLCLENEHWSFACVLVFKLKSQMQCINHTLYTVGPIGANLAQR